MKEETKAYLLHKYFEKWLQESGNGEFIGKIEEATFEVVYEGKTMVINYKDKTVETI